PRPTGRAGARPSREYNGLARTRSPPYAHRQRRRSAGALHLSRRTGPRGFPERRYASDMIRQSQPFPAGKPVCTELSLHERLLKALAELSFEKPTPVQAAAIPPAIAGEDLYISAQTGSGKTAAYVLPILQRLLDDDSKALAPRALVLSPTRELAQQILKDVQALARFTFLKVELVIGGEDFKV